MASTLPSHKPSSPLLSTHLRRRRRPQISNITVLSRRSHWSSADADITTHLLNSLPTTPPPAVTAPMLHLISAAPPSIAPSLCLAACDLVGGPRAAAMGTAAALRLMHAASHAHAALLRRNPNPYPDGIVLLTADGILPLGYEMAAKSDGSDPARVVKVILEIATVMGSSGVTDGRLRERERGEDERVVEMTEGGLAACGAACGAILGGGEGEEVERMRRFGFYAGMMYGLLVREVVEKAEAFRARARLELDGFEEGKKVEVVRGLVDFWFEEGREKGSVSKSVLPL